MKPTVKIKPMMLGDLPCAALAQAGLILDVGMVHFNMLAQKHALSRHGSGYERCLPHLSNAATTPTHVGQSPHHSDGFELVRVVETGLIVLLAVKMERTKSGLYLATSTYPIDRNTLDRRVRKGHLIAL